MDISIIIANYNTSDLLKNCLESIFKTVSGIGYEIIVIDNASCDGSIDMVKHFFPEVHIIGNEQNRGFGAAVNQGLDVMRGRYAMLLNTDAILTKGAAEELLGFMESRPNAAMACGQLRNADGSKQNSIGNFPTLITLLVNVPLLEVLCPTKYPSKRYEYKEPIEIDSGIGACLMVRKKAIDEVGKLDERFFFFFEETDWARSMRNAGWRIYLVPTANIYHFQGQSIGATIRSRIEFYRSRYQYFKKWNSYPHYLMIALVIFLRLILNGFFYSVAVLMTLSMNRKIRDKWIIYLQLILWHIGSPRGVRMQPHSESACTRGRFPSGWF